MLNRIFDFLFLILPYSLFFNLKYLPFRVAIRLPILLYKPKLLTLKGSVYIDAKNISFGMIRLGLNIVPIYPNSGIIWDVKGGEIFFKGKCKIGNNSAISVEKSAKIIFGDDFEATSSFKCVCHYSITFSDKISFGWDCMVVDTDFHRISSLNKKEGGRKGYNPIVINENTWFGMKCLIMKGTMLPSYCIIGANSLLNKKYDYPSYSLIAGNPAVLKATGVYRNFDNDLIEFE